MNFKSFFAMLWGLLAATAASAQTPSPAPAPVTIPAPEPENIWNLDLSTGGRVSIQLRPDAAPAHVERIKTLTRQGFYDGLTFHRVIEGFMAQGGDPTGTGSGGAGLPSLTAERGLPHLRGAVAMARTEAEESGDSQFYVMLVSRLQMDRSYSVFGRVIGGMNFVDAIERGEPPVSPTRIVKASIGSDNVPLLPAEQLIAAGRAPPPAPASVVVQGDGLTDGPAISLAPQSDQSAPQPVGSEPQPEEASPQPEEVSPQPEGASPQPGETATPPEPAAQPIEAAPPREPDSIEPAQQTQPQPPEQAPSQPEQTPPTF